jgi:UPF0716 protein FxsA
MFTRLLLLFTLGPLLELYLLIVIGRHIGPLPTILIVLATGLLGVFLARAQGFLVLGQISDSLRRGELPGEALVEGVLVLIGSAFLLTPGLVTDAAGFALLLPGSRASVRRFVLRRLKRALEAGTLGIYRR